LKGKTIKPGLNESEDPLMLKLDAKYTYHDDLDDAFERVKRDEVLLIESQQMAKYRIKTHHTNEELKNIFQVPNIAELQTGFL